MRKLLNRSAAFLQLIPKVNLTEKISMPPTRRIKAWWTQCGADRSGPAKRQAAVEKPQTK